MSFFDNHYPHTDFHELNLDWLIKSMLGLEDEMNVFKAANIIKWEGAWSIEKAYAKNSIVDFNNNGYIALKPVPVGIEIDNSDYWVKVANYSALYAEMQMRIDELIARLGRDETKYDNNLAILNRDTQLLNEHDSLIQNPKMFIISDSYGMSDGAGGWCSRLASKLTHAFDKITYDARSGYGFVGNDGTFLQILTAKNNALSEAQRKEITHIVVGGGWNDYNKTNENIGNAIQQFMNYARSHFPNAKVYIAMIGWDTQPSVKLNTVLFAYKWYASLNGAAYISNSEYVARSLVNMNDTRHPNATGYENISRFMALYFLSGSCEWELNNVTMTMEANAGVAGINTTGCKQYIHNNNVNVFMPAQTLTLSNVPFVFNNSTPVELASINGGALKGNDLGTAGENIFVTYRIGGNLTYGSGRICIRNRKLVFIPNFTAGQNSTSQVFPTNLYLPIISFSDSVLVE